MPIDINNISSNTTQAKSAAEQKHVKIVHSDSTSNSGKSGSASASLSPDSVSLTSASVRIKALEEQISRLPIVDTQKVEEIKNSINNGKFDFNSERIAEKLISFEKELL